MHKHSFGPTGIVEGPAAVSPGPDAARLLAERAKQPVFPAPAPLQEAAIRLQYTQPAKPHRSGLWAAALQPAYRSLGLRPHIDTAATRLGFADRSLVLRTEGLWHLTQIQNSLGYLSQQTDPEKYQGFIDRIVAIRDALAVGLEAVDTAIVQATASLGMELPAFAVPLALPFTVIEAEPLTTPRASSCQPPLDDPEETSDGPRQLREPEPDTQRDNLAQLQSGGLAGLLALLITQNPALANPTTAATVAATGGGSTGGLLAAGTYLASTLWYPPTGQDDRTNYAGLTSEACSVDLNNGTHGFTIGLNAQNVFSPFEDDLPLNDLYMQASTENNLWDPTAGSDFTLTIS